MVGRSTMRRDEWSKAHLQVSLVPSHLWADKDVFFPSGPGREPFT